MGRDDDDAKTVDDSQTDETGENGEAEDWEPGESDLAPEGEKHLAETTGGSRMDYRLSLRSKEKYIIEDLFPAGLLHLISGASGMGKTTWLLQILSDWSRGRKVLGGKKSYPCPWVYITADRTTLETDRTLRRLGMADWDIPAYAIEEVQQSPDMLQLYHRFRSADLFVIEGLQGFLPDAGGKSQNAADIRWLINVRKSMLSHGKTIIATTHQPKGTNTKETQHSRNAVLGSVSLVGGCGTIVTLDYAEGVTTAARDMGERVVTIEPKDAPKAVIRYRRGDGGIFQEIREDENLNGMMPEDFGLDQMLTYWPAKDPIRIVDLKQWALKTNVSRATLYRWVQKQITNGKMQMESRGIYRKLIPS